MDFDKYYLKALKYLNIRPRSEKEILDYLQKNKADKLVIQLVINKLKEQKFLNDEEFAKMWVRSRTEFKPKGKYVLQLELKQKGITQEIIESVLFENAKEHPELDLAADVLKRKQKKYQNMDRQERFNKAGQMLARRGFGLDVIKSAIDQVFKK